MMVKEEIMNVLLPALPQRKGFTILELLIVIAIIAILVSMGTVAYSSAQKKARDGKRTADMKAIQNAYEQYYADNNSVYPATVNSLSGTYLPAGVPEDPKPLENYTHSYPGGGYCSCAELESTTTGGNADDAACTYDSAGGSFYCVSSLQ